MAMTQRDKRAIIGGGCGLAALLLAYFVILPWISDWQSTRQRLTSARSELTSLEARTQKLLGRRRRLSQALGPATGKPLPDLAKARLQAVETIKAAMSGPAKSIRPESARPLREAPGVVMLTIRVEGTAKLKTLTSALADLRRADQLILIDRIELTHPEERKKSLSFSLTLSTPAKQTPDA